MELSKTKAAVYASLSSKKMRRKHGLFLAEGEKCVVDTLGAFELESIVATRDWIATHLDLCRDWENRVLEASDTLLKKISTLSNASEVIAVFHIPEQNKILENFNDELILLLDGIQDPGNLGTIVRTADWFGVDKVIASEDTVDIYNPKAIQATMGSLKRVKVCYADLCSVINCHQSFPVYGMMLEGNDIFKTTLGQAGFIVMGNEGNGLSEDVRSLVDHPLLIPPYRDDSHGESLNVAIAIAITLSTFRNH